jgi:hypothetical protein
MLDALAAWPVAAALRDSAVAYPIINAAHIISIGLLLGAIVTLDLRLLGAFRSHPLAHLAPPLVRVAATGLAGAAMTGLLLFSTRPGAYAENPAFLAKLALVGCGLMNALVLRLNPKWMEISRDARMPLSVQVQALVSLLTWIAAVIAGRWIGFLQ